MSDYVSFLLTYPKWFWISQSIMPIFWQFPCGAVDEGSGVVTALAQVAVTGASSVPGQVTSTCFGCSQKIKIKLIFFFFFFSHGCTWGIWKFPGQGSNLNCSYSNAGSLTCTRLGVEPIPPQGLKPLHHRWNSPYSSCKTGSTFSRLPF